MTDHPPVEIETDEWPVIASAKSWDNTYESQANHLWEMIVRQHADGRCLVYSSFITNWQGECSMSGGTLVPAGGDIVAAIRLVADDTNMNEQVERQLIAGLPAVKL